MAKFVNFIKSIITWISIDGLLHFLVCYSLMLTLYHYINIPIAILAIGILALSKEYYDFYIQKDNTINQVLHDIICDALGIIAGIIVITIRNLI